MTNKIALLICATALTACGALKNMDEMKKTTQEMKTTADGMAVTTAKMESSMSDSMMSMRTGLGFTANKDNFDAIIESDSMDQKAIFSRAYFNTFEFQSWTGRNTDTRDIREELFRQALHKFYADFSEVTLGIDNIETLPPATNPSEKENRINSAIMIAMSMHEISPHQKHFAHERKFEMKSMLHLISEGLAAYTLEKSGKGTAATAPEYIKVTLNNIPLARTIMQIRYNGLSLKLLTMISELGKTKMEDAKTLVAMTKSPWFAKFDKLDNTATAERALNISKLIIQTKGILNGLNAQLSDLEISSNWIVQQMTGFSVLMKNMNVGSARSTSKAYSGSATELKANLDTIKSFYK